VLDSTTAEAEAEQAPAEDTSQSGNGTADQPEQQEGQKAPEPSSQQGDEPGLQEGRDYLGQPEQQQQQQQQQRQRQQQRPQQQQATKLQLFLGHVPADFAHCRCAPSTSQVMVLNTVPALVLACHSRYPEVHTSRPRMTAR
jgi:hypothetical protein